MSFKYKLAAALISLPIFFSVFLFPCLQLRASAAGSDSWIDRLAAYQVSKWEDLPSDFQALAQAYVDTFNSIGTKGYFENVSDIPLNWYYILDDTTPVLSIGGAVFYYLDSNGKLKYTKKGSSGAGNSIQDNAQLVGSGDDLVVDGKTFKKYINDRSTYYEPTGNLNKISWKTEPIFSSSDFDYFRSNGLTFLYQGNFFKVSGLEDVYCALYYFDGTDYYYSQNGFHFYLDEWSDSSGGSGLSLFYDVYNFNEPADFTNDIQVFEDISAYPYIKFLNFYSADGSYGGSNRNYSINGFRDLATFLKNRGNGGNPDIWYNDEFILIYNQNIDLIQFLKVILLMELCDKELMLSQRRATTLLSV